jgi:hypothetical protein
MDRRNVTALNRLVHEGLCNSYTGALIGFTCAAPHYEVLRLNSMPEPERLTDDRASCTGCRAILDGNLPHPADVAHEIADLVLADADRRGYPPALDNEGLRLVFERLAPDIGDMRPLFERLARGVYDPRNSYRTQPLYALVRQHLDDQLTERARVVPKGTPEVLVRYTRYTGGDIRVPVGVGDRLTYDGLASGHWPTGTVASVEDSGILVDYHDGYPPRHYKRHEVPLWFAFKVNRAPLTNEPQRAV